MDQIQIQLHVKGIEELRISRFRIMNGPVGVDMGTDIRASLLLPC